MPTTPPYAIRVTGAMTAAKTFFRNALGRPLRFQSPE